MDLLNQHYDNAGICMGVQAVHKLHVGIHSAIFATESIYHVLECPPVSRARVWSLFCCLSATCCSRQIHEHNQNQGKDDGMQCRQSTRGHTLYQQDPAGRHTRDQAATERLFREASPRPGRH